MGYMAAVYLVIVKALCWRYREFKASVFYSKIHPVNQRDFYVLCIVYETSILGTRAT